MTKQKRSLITVDAEAWDGIQAILPELKISKGLFNSVLNAFIRNQYEVLSGMYQRRDVLSQGDILRVLSSTISKLEGKEQDLL
jgi:hypothetical protein